MQTSRACLPPSLSPILFSLTMATHPLHPTPNIPLRLLRSIFPHIPPDLLHFAFFGLDARDADAFAHLAAYGFGLAGGAHGWMGFVGWWGTGGFGEGEELGESCSGCFVRFGSCGVEGFGGWGEGRTFWHVDFVSVWFCLCVSLPMKGGKRVVV